MTKTLAFNIRAENVDAEKREFTGLAVPYDTPTKIFSGWSEQVKRGAVTLPENRNIPLFRGHEAPIGSIQETWDADAGLMIRAKISDTDLGNETLTLIRDGVLTGLSIGFIENRFEDHWNEHGENLRTQQEIELKEISVVSFPAYSDAQITAVRNAQTEYQNRKETPMTTTTVSPAELVEIREDIADVKRDMAAIAAKTTVSAEKVDTRSIGELFKDAFEKNDPTAISALNTREYQGGKSSDDASFTVIPAAVKDLTRLVMEANPLAEHISHEPLPEKGTKVEYLEIASNTINVADYEEGADIPFGKLTTKTRYAEVQSHAGGAQLTLKEIKRSPVNILNTTVKAMAIAAGNHAGATLTQFFKTSITAQAKNAVTTSGALSTLTWQEFKNIVIDVQQKMIKQGFTPDVLVVDVPTFKAITSWADSTGAPLVNVFGEGTNQVGEAGIKSGSANVFIKIVPDWRADTANFYGEKVLGVFFAKEAVKLYRSKVVDFSQFAITNFTEALAVYFESVQTLEYPDAFIPFKAK